MRAPHRKAPNRIRELRERVHALVQERIGPGIICSQCGTTLASYADKCEAYLDERCPGFKVIDRVQMQAEKEMGLT